MLANGSGIERAEVTEPFYSSVADARCPLCVRHTISSTTEDFDEGDRTYRSAGRKWGP